MIVAIDFDGVIHKYSKGFGTGEIYDPPVKGAYEFLKGLVDSNHSIFIFSTRNSIQIQEWMKNQFPDLYFEQVGKRDFFWNYKKVIGITNRKLPAQIYIDDRGYKFEGSFNGLLEEIQEFKTWGEIERIPKKVCPHKDAKGNCPLHNIHCRFPDCEK